MMKLSYLKTHWTPEEAHTILSFLDDVRDTLWRTYGSDMVDHDHQQHIEEQETLSNFEDNNIPF